MSFKRLENLLKPNDDGELAEIIGHAQQMGALVHSLHQSLPADMAGSVRAANIRDAGELVILASSSAWAAKLRFHADSLMAAARGSGAEVRSCRVRVSRG